MALGDIVTAPVQNIQTDFSVAQQPFPDIIHIAGTVFAIAQKQPPNKEIRTYNITNAGVIAALGVAQLGDVGNTFYYNDIIPYGDDLYVIASHQIAPAGTDGEIDLVQISDDGLTVNWIGATQVFSVTVGSDLTLIRIGPGRFAVWYESSVTGDGHIQTFDLTPDGLTFNLIANFIFQGAGADYVEGDAIHIAGNVYATVYGGGFGGAPGRIRTMSISDDGLTMANIDTALFEPVRARFCRIIHVTGDLYAISYSGTAGNDGWLTVVEITAAGAITVLGSVEFDNVSCERSDIIHLGLDMVAVFYQSAGNAGDVVTIEIGDGTAPAVYDGPDNWIADARWQRVARLPSTNTFALAFEAGPFFGWLATFNIDGFYPPFAQTNPATGVT